MPYPLNTPLGRFGVETSEEGPERCVASIPAGGLLNPITGAPTIAPLAMLVDHVGGLSNHCRRADGQWTVSSELSLEVTGTAIDAIGTASVVVATSRPLGGDGGAALSLCELRAGREIIATATVRSFYIEVPGDLTAWSDEPAGSLPGTRMDQLMALDKGETGGTATVLMQREDPVLNNSIGIVHGGVSSMGLELVGSACINGARGDTPADTLAHSMVHTLADAPYRTASLRVNFLRPFHGGAGAHYRAERLHRGRSSGVAEAQAVGHDGRVAMVARVTAYR